MYKQVMEVPKSLKYLILSNNEIIQKHKAELMQQVYEASIEQMNLLNLRPEEGWRLDTENLRFVQIEVNKEDATVSE